MFTIFKKYINCTSPSAAIPPGKRNPLLSDEGDTSLCPWILVASLKFQVKGIGESGKLGKSMIILQCLTYNNTWCISVK